MSAQTPQFVLEHASLEARGLGARSSAHRNTHLDDEQFCELLALSATDAEAHPHVLACAECAAELSTMRSSLGLFRDASRAYADDELRRLPQMALPSRGMISPALKPAWWLTAAALMLAALTPLQMQRVRASHGSAAVMDEAVTASSAQSDEALLEDVDREASASLPSSLQALANPTSLDVPTSNASQRKD